MISVACKIFSHKELRLVWQESKRRFKATCSGIDPRSVDQIEPILNRYITDIRKRLANNYQVEGLLGIPIKKVGSAKSRIICVPTYAYRMVQFALQDALRPEMAKLGIENRISFGILRGTASGVEQARNMACTYRGSRAWAYKTDIVAFFDEIPRAELKCLISTKIRQRSLHRYLHAVIDAEVTRGVGQDWRSELASTSIRTGRGIRQGMPLSPILSAFYLMGFDQAIIAANVPAIRYADDFIAFFATEKECIVFHEMCKEILADIGLLIKEPNAVGSKTRIYSPTQPAEFLGMEISIPQHGRCQLTVSDDRLKSICESIDQIGDIDYLNSNKIRFQALEGHASSVTRGLMNAYRTAHNINQLKDAIHSASQAAQSKVLTEVFGQTFLNTLEPRKRSFLGIKPKA